METTESNNPLKSLTLKPGKEESLLRRHPWVFSGAIDHKDSGICDGDAVRVLTSDGCHAATGHYQGGSIAVRVLSFSDTAPDASFWRRRLQSALDVRRLLGFVPTGGPPPAARRPTTAFRLVHGEGDMLPGLVVDIYGRTAVMQAHSMGMHRCRCDIAGALMDVMDGSITGVYYKSETTLSFAEPQNGFLAGCGDGGTAVENGLHFHVDWLEGQKTGFFVDQRENRELVERYSRDRSVLNMFCYTGGFSFYAMRGGARLVHSVDSSERAIELTRRNVELNFPGDPRHEAFCEDAFRYLNKLKCGAKTLRTPSSPVRRW